MNRTFVVLSLTTMFFAGSALSQSTPASQARKTDGATVAGTSPAKPADSADVAQSPGKKPVGTATHSKPRFSAHHQGPWEEQIGYSQAVQAGRTIYISGTVGANEKGFPADMESQMQLAYAAIRESMSHYGADFSNVVMERIYTTDIEALIKCQEARKKIYGDWLPAASWVEVRRLYAPEAKIEIEVEVVVK